MHRVKIHWRSGKITTVICKNDKEASHLIGINSSLGLKVTHEKIEKVIT